MKRLLTVIMIIVMMILGCVPISDNKQDDNEYVEFEYAKPLVKNLGDKVSVEIDPKIESAYMVIEMIATETGFSQFEDSTYMNDQIQYFSEYKDHEVFNIARKMVKSGFNYGSIASSMHMFDDENNLKSDIIADSKIIEQVGGIDRIEEFAKALYDFRKYSDYDSYFKSNNIVYEEYLSRAEQYLVSSRFYEVFSSYYGDMDCDIRIVITPDCTHGYGCFNRYEDRMELLPTISVGAFDKDFIGMLLHELSHPYVNTETAKREAEVSGTKDLFVPISGPMSSKKYSNWEISLNEHIVRANTIYMMGQIYGDQSTNFFLKREDEDGFKYINPIYDSIMRYQENRYQYKKFSQYFNVLMDDVEKIGPID